MGEARKPPKPSIQGSAGKANVRQPEHGVNGTSGNTMDGLRTNSINKPGKSTKGSGATNSPSRT
jgi:hypothetical protein